MVLRLRPYFLAFAAIAMLEAIAAACSCITDDLSTLLDRADLVVFGEVERYEMLPGCDNQTEVHLRVIQAFVSGEVGQAVVLDSGDPRSSCSLIFAEGETWLILSEQGHTNYCAGSRRVSADDPILVDVADRLNQAE